MSEKTPDPFEIMSTTRSMRRLKARTGDHHHPPGIEDVG